MEVKSRNAQDTKELARRIAQVLKPYDVLALYGDLGTGKTTFTRFLVEELGINSRVQSPTFVLMRKYENLKATNKISIVNHLDLYRLGDFSELHELSLPEIFSEKNSITIIEWPEIAQEILPENCIKIYFESLSENERKITVEAK